MMKFLCDEMCAELGKWLRIAGYDTAIIQKTLEDLEVFQKAESEDRILITRDEFFKTLDSKRVIYLKGEDIESWALQLKEKGVDWLYQPFSRCLQCNSLFEEMDCTLVEVPENVHKCWVCPICHHVFWLGSHTKHMETRLRNWASTES